MYVGRRLDGSIYGTWTSRQPKDDDHPNIEELPDNHPDVVAFMTRTIPNTKQALLDALDSATTIAQVKAAVKDLLK